MNLPTRLATRLAALAMAATAGTAALAPPAAASTTLSPQDPATDTIQKIVVDNVLLSVLGLGPVVGKLLLNLGLIGKKEP
ncbi:hypothetical protein [Actinomadura rudentiformis]|uniref:Secreted protein n=1 Tax=Actinomadura rudentiformis TaxID=359158 RepID=A0A6H9YI19_9ACTN|nr:hypothetical protein [Actinomadura rudentiformis]KAB2344847.1 hypothetical protein F8566_30105 [Actinomadura rudentiformis]